MEMPNYLKYKITPTKVYWFVQLSSCSLYFLVKFLISLLSFVSAKQLLLNYSLPLLVFIVLTHLFRKLYLSKWTTLPFPKLLVRVLFGCFILFLLYLLCLFLITALLLIIAHFVGYVPPSIGVNNLQSSEQKMLVLYNGIADFFAFLLWSFFYLLFQYVKSFKAEQQRKLELDLELQKMRLDLLKRQLNPHFLFNALNSIKALALSDTMQCRNSIDRLCDLLRYSLDNDKRQFIPFKQELFLVTSYLELEKIRFRERLQYSIYCDPALHNAMIPPILLQILVENAVKHGIAKLKRGGSIEIACRVLYDTKVHISVHNDGTIESGADNSLGVGLQNLEDRLSILYPDNYSFNIEQLGNSVKVNLKFPIVYAEAESNYH